MSTAALTFHDVTIRYEHGADPVLAAVSLVVKPAERVALVGLNGSGKTTLLMASVGLIPHDGEIRVGGVVLSRRTSAQIRDQVGFLFNVPEDQLLFPRVIDDVAFGLIRRGIPAVEAASRAMSALDTLGAVHLARWPLHHLSHGQKQRVALAGALITGPPLLLLDEPSAGLDPPGKHSLARQLAGLTAAMVVATHDLDFAVRFCTRFIMLEEGRIVLDGVDPTEVSHCWQSREAAEGKGDKMAFSKP